MPDLSLPGLALRGWPALLCFAAITAAGGVRAQDQPPVASAPAAGSADTVSYPADYFAPFAPQTALDIVNRTPGFVLVAGDEVRGFSGAASNVLIDGARPTLKSGGIQDVLRRIPATAVERVEVLRNASTSEAQGQRTVLNIVRRPGAAGGTWTLEIERNSDGLVYPRGQATYARALGDWQVSVKVNSMWETYPWRSRRNLRDASGDLTAVWIDNRPSTFGWGVLSGEARRPLGGGVLSLNGRVGWETFYYDTDSAIYLARPPSGRPDQLNVFSYDRTTAFLELGGDWTRSLGDWSWKTLGLVSLKDYDQAQQDRLRSAGGGGLISRSNLMLRQSPLEVIGRTTLVRTDDAGLRPELGAEIAYNRLGSDLTLTTDDGSGPVPVVLPAANVVVEELRGEAFANLVWRLSETVTVDGGLAVETSEISVTGDVDRRQTFTFAKPSLSVSWRASPSLQLRAGARRRVGQLDFTDFAASAELSEDETQAGNPDLGPEHAWRYFLAGDYRRGGLAANLELFQEERSDVLALVVLPSGAPGLANAGDATVRGLKGSLTAPLDRLLPGASIKVDAEILDTRFDDPLTGRERVLSSVNTPLANAEFRHDPPGRDWRWGVTYKVPYDWTAYLVNQVDDNSADGVFGAYVETTRFHGLRVRLTVRNINTEHYDRLRTFYAPDRSGIVVGMDQRESERGPFVNLTISGRF